MSFRGNERDFRFDNNTDAIVGIPQNIALIAKEEQYRLKREEQLSILKKEAEALEQATLELTNETEEVTEEMKTRRTK